MKILLAVDGSSQSRDAVRSLAHFAPSDGIDPRSRDGSTRSGSSNDYSRIAGPGRQRN